MSGRRLGLVGAGLALGGMLLLGAGVVVAAQPGAGSGGASGPSVGMMGGSDWGGGSGMMGGSDWGGGGTRPGPGDPGFVAGTRSAPRVVRILAKPNLRFTPGTVRVKAGETIRFKVTVMGPVVHEFMVSPAADVAADKSGTPEIAGISMMQTKSITYTFTGSGPFAYACHAPGHYEAGMTGRIVIVP